MSSSRYKFIVTIRTESLEHAMRVIRERTGHDEDLGFYYAIEDPLYDGLDKSTIRATRTRGTRVPLTSDERFAPLKQGRYERTMTLAERFAWNATLKGVREDPRIAWAKVEAAIQERAERVRMDPATDDRGIMDLAEQYDRGILDENDGSVTYPSRVDPFTLTPIHRVEGDESCDGGPGRPHERWCPGYIEPE